MSEQKESSVLFSLKELMNLEEDRIKTEEADKAAQAASAERARLDAERAAREAEEARIRAEEERRRADEQRARENDAKLQAIRIAEVEKARVEAEQRARLEAMAVQQQHEKALATIQHDDSKKKLRKMLIGIIVAVILIGSVSGFLVYKQHTEAQARIAAQEAQQQALEDEKKKLEANAKEQAQKIDNLLTSLSSAKDEATRLALQKQLEEERAKQDALKKGGGGSGRPASGGGTSGGSKAPCNCSPGDPLCSCL